MDVRERRPVTAASSFVVDSKSFELRVLDEPGDLLEVTPGLYVAQHAGGGKATQYLVRGFDADHGTDLAIAVDDVPVNMRSHAHGQGYSDLNFVIPETIEKVEITKGPYEAEDLDFVTAGSVNLVTRERVDESYLRFEGGSFDSQRYLALLSPRTGIFEGCDEAPVRALFAFDAVGTDGTFDNEEDLWQYKGLARMGFDLGERTSLESTTQFYRGDWDASGEIPKRLVDGPGFDRWDAVDASDGGHSTTTRTLLRLVHELSEHERLEAAGWFAWYDLTLYSNFTFFLDDAANGDQIEQRDHRTLYGGWLTYARNLEVTPIPVVVRSGLWTRSDDADVRLSHTSGRSFVSPTSDDHVRETSLAGWAEVEALPLPWVRTVLGLRAEEFWYDVGDRSGLGRPDGHERNDAVLPKASLILRPFGADAPLASESLALRELELFLNYGQGIHSNDARDVAANGDQVTLPEANGYEIGVRTRFFERLEVALAYWWLDSESEFVFVGDAGTTEAKPSSRRRGVELSSELDPRVAVLARRPRLLERGVRERRQDPAGRALHRECQPDREPPERRLR